MNNKINRTKKIDKIDDLKLFGEAILIGILAGVIISGYRYVLHFIEKNLFNLRDILILNRFYIFCFFVVLLLFSLITGYIRQKEKYCGGSGIPQIEAEIKGFIYQNPIRVMIAKIIGGITCAIGGLSLGREGPSIQIGAMCGKLISQLLKRKRTTERFLLTCGAGAGLSAAFNAPIAGVIFSIEEVHRYVSKKLLITCITGCMTADFIAKLFYGNETVFHFNTNYVIPLKDYWLLICLGIILSILGMIYMFFMKKFTSIYKRLNISILWRPIIPFILGGILLFVLPEVIGGGNVMLEGMISNNLTISFIITIFLIKLLFSIISFTSGVPGGIFFPILVMGSAIGAIFSQIYSSESLGIFIILSMAGFLTAIVRAPLTAIILIFEMTGNIQFLLPLSIVCLICFCITNYFEVTPVYDYLLDNLIENSGIETNSEDEQITICVNVKPGSISENKTIQYINLPKTVLVTKIERGSVELIPHGDTVLIVDDVLTILCNDKTLYADMQIIEEIFSEKVQKKDNNEFLIV